jgi:hypothetical protein
MPIFWKIFPRMRCLSRPTLRLETVSSQKFEYLGLKSIKIPSKFATLHTFGWVNATVPVGGTVA